MYHKFVQHHNLRLSSLVMKQVNLEANDRAGEHVLIVCAEKLRLMKRALCARARVCTTSCSTSNVAFTHDFHKRMNFTPNMRICQKYAQPGVAILHNSSTLLRALYTCYSAGVLMCWGVIQQAC